MEQMTLIGLVSHWLKGATALDNLRPKKSWGVLHQSIVLLQKK